MEGLLDKLNLFLSFKYYCVIVHSVSEVTLLSLGLGYRTSRFWNWIRRSGRTLLLVNLIV